LPIPVGAALQPSLLSLFTRYFNSG